MDPFARRDASANCISQQIPFVSSAQSTMDVPRFQSSQPELKSEPDRPEVLNVSFMKGPKRKRLAKACDACHKSKRRCDGTAPCSNCYFASKKCTYTDASGRPVPAPRPSKSERGDAPADTPRQTSYINNHPENFQQGQAPLLTLPPLACESAPPVTTLPDSEEDVANSRKRLRSEFGLEVSANENASRVRAQISNIRTDRSLGLDPLLTRQLVNLFFAHRHPHCMIIHKPTFLADLSQNRVALPLLYIICALAAPLSRQPNLKTNPPRFAGQTFAREAASLLLDNSGRLLCEPNLATAQALCLLQMHEAMTKPSWDMHYHEYALQILEQLGLYKHSSPILTPVPSPEFIHESIERECIRRTFWLIHFTDLSISIKYQRPVSLKDGQLMVRLPVDETSFELAVHSTLPEYMYLPAPRTQYASEFGHLIRMLSIHAKIEHTMDIFNSPNSGAHPVAALMGLEQSLEAWVASLPDHLRFSEENLAVQMSMFETSSNTGAWCFCLIHVLHSSCVLALNSARQRCRTAMPGGPPWAHSRLQSVMDALGSRAKYSSILGAAVWPLIKYCYSEHPQCRTWAAEYEDVWGFRIDDFCVPPPRPMMMRPPPHLRFPTGSATPPVPHCDENEVSSSGKANSLSSGYTSLSRSSNDLWMHNTPPNNNADGRGASGKTERSREKETRRLVSDTDIDPMLQTVPNQQRVHGPLDGGPSLPSLKASGLLDSWSAPNVGDVPPMAAVGQSNWNVPQHMAHQPGRPSMVDSVRSPLLSGPAEPSGSQRINTFQNNSAGGMPVGLQWLANEAAAMRQV